MTTTLHFSGLDRPCILDPPGLGRRKNKSTFYRRRGARLARRENAEIFVIFQVFTTQPGGMGRRSEM